MIMFTPKPNWLALPENTRFLLITSKFYGLFYVIFSSEVFDCKKLEGDYECTDKMVSIFMKIYDIDAVPLYKTCDPIFQEKYADVTYAFCSFI